jgi:flagellar biosynthesis protein FliR
VDELFRQLGQLLNYTQELLILALILGRTVAMIQLTPFLGGKIAPMQVKMAMGVVLTIIVWPLARDVVDLGNVPLGALPFLFLMLKEVFIGFIIGFVNSHMFYVMDMAGRLIDTTRGTSMSEVQDPHSKQRVTPVGDMYGQLFLVIFLAINGHHIFFEAFFYSFESLPVSSTLAWGDPKLEAFMEQILRIGGDIWSISVVLAAPIVAATFITDVVFGILNRVAPQLNAYFMSMPVKAFGGIVMIFIALEAITIRMTDWVVWVLVQLQDILALLYVQV